MKPEIPRNLIIIHPVYFENWGPETPDKRGIGQSETAQIELAWRMAERGWNVTCYAPLEPDSPREWRGVHWRELHEADYARPGYWLIWRSPETLDQFSESHYGQFLGLVSQDESYGDRWNEERCKKLDMMFGLCEAHKHSIESDHALLKGKVVVSSNGIKLELIREIEKTPAPPRDPHRIMYASSPDRGLLPLLKIFRRVREYVPDASLYIAYGFENIDKLLKAGPQFSHFKKIKDAILKECQQPGVHWLGRIPQPQLLQEWRKTALLVYPTLFRETSMTTIMEAQAMGAFPVCSPVWAQGENLRAGSLIPGDPNDPLISARYVGEVVGWLQSHSAQDTFRPYVMSVARRDFCWQRQVDKYEALMLGFSGHRHFSHQFSFQIKHCLGADSILNVGCADDPAELKKLGAINLDSRTEDPIFHRKTAADIVADCRTLPNCLNGKRFDRVVCGDMLEHFPVEEVPLIMRKLKACLNPGGKLIITVPDDHRPAGVQHSLSDGSDQYHDGISAVHLHPISKHLLQAWCNEAGLLVEAYQPIHTEHYEAHGVVCIDTEYGETNQRRAKPKVQRKAHTVEKRRAVHHVR